MRMLFEERRAAFSAVGIEVSSSLNGLRDIVNDSVGEIRGLPAYVSMHSSARGTKTGSCVDRFLVICESPQRNRPPSTIHGLGKRNRVRKEPG